MSLAVTQARCLNGPAQLRSLSPSLQTLHSVSDFGDVISFADFLAQIPFLGIHSCDHFENRLI